GEHQKGEHAAQHQPAVAAFVLGQLAALPPFWNLEDGHLTPRHCAWAQDNSRTVRPLRGLSMRSPRSSKRPRPTVAIPMTSAAGPMFHSSEPSTGESGRESSTARLITPPCTRLITAASII